MADDFNYPTTNTKQMPDDIVSQAALVNQTYSYTNNVGFYTAASPAYYDYYLRVIRPCSQWLDGYVFNFHNIQRGFFSTRLASTLVNGIGNHIVGQRIFFEKDSKDTDQDVVDFIDNWSKRSRFQSAARNAIKTALGLGTSMLKINKSKDDLWAEDVRIDYVYFEADSMLKVTNATFLLKGYYNLNHSKDSKKEKNYYFVEHRFFKPVFKKKFREDENGNAKWFWKKVGREPMVEYNVYEYTGNSMTAQTYVPKGSNKMSFNSLPREVKDSLRDNYDIYELDVPQKLPFNDYLGCELLRNDDKDITLPNTPFGRPMLLDIQSYLMGYDMAYSYMMRDLYLGKGSVIVPKGMTAPGQQQNIDSVFNGNDSAYFQAVPTLDPDKQKPLSVQFDLRAEEWEKVQNNILRKISTTIGMSPKAIASYLEDNGPSRKTATEVNAEDDATISYISIKRSIFEIALNRILECVLSFYGKLGKITVKFATPSLVNMDKIVDRVYKLRQTGLLSDKQSLRMIFPDDDDDQIEAKLEELKEYLAENRENESVVKMQEQQDLQEDQEQNI